MQLSLERRRQYVPVGEVVGSMIAAMVSVPLQDSTSKQTVELPLSPTPIGKPEWIRQDQVSSGPRRWLTRVLEAALMVHVPAVLPGSARG